MKESHSLADSRPIMSSSDEILARLHDPEALASWLKENAHLSLADADYSLIVEHFLRSTSTITAEALAVQRNLYGRARSSPLSSPELDLLTANTRHCLSSSCPSLSTVFLQYLHNVSRCLPAEFDDLSYLCSLTLLSSAKKSVLACLLCAYLEKNPSANVRFDLLVNHFYASIDAEQPWIEQLTAKLIDSEVPWLRKFYLERRFPGELLNAIDQHQKEKILELPAIKPIVTTEETSTRTIFPFSLGTVSSLTELHQTLRRHLTDDYPLETLQPECLVHLFSAAKPTSYPVDLHALFICSSLLVDESLAALRLFRQLIDRLNNYYIHQQDSFDDDHYRLVLVFLLSHFLRNVQQRRSKGDHPWYRLYQKVPDEYPLPTSDLFADLLLLLATLVHDQRACQDQVREVTGAIEAILSMTQIDLNQPKAQACVVWLIKCLTNSNEENRNYIKQIQ